MSRRRLQDQEYIQLHAKEKWEKKLAGPAIHAAPAKSTTNKRSGQNNAKPATQGKKNGKMMVDQSRDPPP